ncbi:plasmid pRiA4b ORF-3 family protein [Weeksellaceae bacterium TAE3-ERU29]|nr:plasmid pRiA4b ORF-3 family protein [Weeksellaceae bacterium TAE3-ERU29]
MILKIRVILDTEQDVFRDIEINEDNTLLDFHKEIKTAFNLEGDEMASFFLSNEQWFQGSEIPMEDMSGEPDAEIMSNTTLKAVTPKKGGRMIYLYDFLAMWTFYCEVVDVLKPDNSKEYPLVSLAYGERPENAPEKESMDFSLDEDGLDFDDDFDDEEEDYFDEDPYSYY